MKKPTKRSAAKSCKVGKAPSREQYTACKKDVKRWRTNKSLQGISDVVDAAYVSLGDGYQPPHEMPPYGGRCYIQIYNENMLWLQLCYTMQAYINAWQVSEDCLHPIA